MPQNTTQRDSSDIAQWTKGFHLKVNTAFNGISNWTNDQSIQKKVTLLTNSDFD